MSDVPETDPGGHNGTLMLVPLVFMTGMIPLDLDRW